MLCSSCKSKLNFFGLRRRLYYVAKHKVTFGNCLCIVLMNVQSLFYQDPRGFDQWCFTANGIAKACFTNWTGVICTKLALGGSSQYPISSWFLTYPFLILINAIVLVVEKLGLRDVKILFLVKLTLRWYCLLSEHTLCNFLLLQTFERKSDIRSFTGWTWLSS